MDNNQISFLSYANMFKSNGTFNSSVSFLKGDLSNSLYRAFQFAFDFNQPVVGLCGALTENLEACFMRCFDFDQSLITWDFSAVTLMKFFMFEKSAADYSTTNMDILLNRLVDPVYGVSFSNFTDPNIDFGSIDYTSAGAAALASLISDGFVINIGNEV